MTTPSRRPADPRRAMQRDHYTKAEVLEARTYFVLGWPLSRIAGQLKIPRAAIYKWCVLGLHHQDAIPDGFPEARAAYSTVRTSSADRIDQIPRQQVRKWRELFMSDSTSMGVIQLEISELEVRTPVTGLESEDWASSDLFNLLLGSSRGRKRPYPHGHESIPAGFTRWWKRHAKSKAEELLAIEEQFRNRHITSADMVTLTPIIGRLADELEPDFTVSRPIGYVGELTCVSSLSSLKPMPLKGGIRQGCLRSAVSLANALMAARAEDKKALSRFVDWGTAYTQHDHQSQALWEDIDSIADRCGFTLDEARRVLRLAQEARFMRGAGKAELADAELERAYRIYDSDGVVVEPDTSFSRGVLRCGKKDLLTGRFDWHARKVRLRDRRAAVRDASRQPSEARRL